MKLRRFAVGFAILAGLGGGALAAVPRVALYYAESQVDEALAQIRKHSTSVVNRGPVTVDLSTRTVTVKDLSIDGPGDASKVSVARLVIGRPAKRDDLLTADKVIFENVTVELIGETVKVPRIEIQGYSGPAQGLVTTPGIGTSARTQADVIAQVSASRAVIPSIEVTGDQTGIRRTVRNVVVGSTLAGVVESGTVDSMAIEAQPVDQVSAPGPRAFEMTTGPVAYERLNLPTLWRFYAGDGVGAREPLAKRFSVAGVVASSSLGAGGRAGMGFDRLEVANVAIRPLAFSVKAVYEATAKLRRAAPLTPADVRQQLLMLSDASHILSFDRVTVSGAHGEAELPDGPRASGRLALASIGPYADARIEAITVEGLDYAGGAARGAVSRAEIEQIDATALAAYVGRVGRDEILLTSELTADDIIRTAPRVSRVTATGATAALAAGRLALDRAKVEIDAPLDAVPQRVSFALEGLQAEPAAGSWIADALKAASLGRLDGSATATLTLDPTTKELSLDAFDCRVNELGQITAKGSLAEFDATIAASVGSKFVDRLSAIVLKPFKITVKNDGAVETLLSRMAAKESAPAEEFRETIAVRAEQDILKLFGPPAAQSGVAAADFIREPHTIELTINPKTPETALLDVLQSIKLGPEGIAQTIDLTVLNRR